MDIQMTRTETVQDLLERITAKYGDLEGAQARIDEEPDAMSAAYWFKQIAADPSVMKETVKTTVLAEVNPKHLSKLTEQRLDLLEIIRRLRHANIREIEIAAGRGYRRVHDDVEILEQVGAVQSHRHGQERIVQAMGTELVIALN